MWGQQGPQKAQVVGSCNSRAVAQSGDTLIVQHISILTPSCKCALVSCVSVKSGIYHSTALLIK